MQQTDDPTLTRTGSHVRWVCAGRSAILPRMLRLLVVALLLATLFNPRAHAQGVARSGTNPPGSRSTRVPRRLVLDAKFGIFIHWGIYCGAGLLDARTGTPEW